MPSTPGSSAPAVPPAAVPPAPAPPDVDVAFKLYLLDVGKAPDMTEVVVVQLLVLFIGTADDVDV